MSDVTEPRLPKVSLFDTTLRDGEQAPGNAMTVEQKLELALAVEAIGVDVVEAGFPSSSPVDFEATRRIANALTTASVATLNRAVRDDVRLAVEAGGTRRHHLGVMATGSDIHLKHKRGISRAEAQAEVVDAIGYARSLGAEHVTLAIEDASRGTDDLLRPLIERSIEAGADTVVVADTTGCMMPAEYGALIGRIRSWVPARTTIATHCHEDMGLSLANALAGVAAGADEVQATLGGVGERAGNTAIEELIAVLVYKREAVGRSTTARPQGLQRAFDVLRGAIGLSAPRNKAIFGVNAFATQAGIHQAGMLRDPSTYEFVEATVFGRERTMLVGRHSGRAVIRHVMGEMGLAPDEALVNRVYAQHVAGRTGGSCMDLRDLRVVIEHELTAPGVLVS
ncbi:LeuA family protein [Streptomyces sp. LZ34]